MREKRFGLVSKTSSDHEHAVNVTFPPHTRKRELEQPLITTNDLPNLTEAGLLLLMVAIFSRDHPCEKPLDVLAAAANTSRPRLSNVEGGVTNLFTAEWQRLDAFLDQPLYRTWCQKKLEAWPL